jgi:hypothetical protein
MTRNQKSEVHLRERVIHELKEFAVIAAYLFVCFTAVACLKAAILKAHGISFAPFAFAAVKALICAKFVSMGQIFHLGERFKSLPLIWPTMYKSLCFLSMLIVLNALEEVFVGFIHGRTIVDSMADFGGGTMDQLVATSFIGFLMLMPFFAFRALGEIVGERNLVQVFFRYRHVAQRSALGIDNQSSSRISAQAHPVRAD